MLYVGTVIEDLFVLDIRIDSVFGSQPIGNLILNNSVIGWAENLWLIMIGDLPHLQPSRRLDP